ncbi:hypothetical protein Y1Q_0005693 [Alligator mississippiensis]|uniref:Uncharacterized protein n=1 Tax=Alligator mississippiensis TaxID=8496 RepID=A0A151MFJ2_ALLMI|nr:hypothetical protein Y1Q_0005693 [Alligator mississippiensis]
MRAGRCWAACGGGCLEAGRGLLSFEKKKNSNTGYSQPMLKLESRFCLFFLHLFGSSWCCTQHVRLFCC